MNDFFDCLFDETPFGTEVPETTETEEECRETEAEASVSAAEGEEKPEEASVPAEEKEPAAKEVPVAAKAEPGEKKPVSRENEYMLDMVKFGLMTQGMGTADKACCKLDFFGEKIAKAASGNAIGNWKGLIDYLKERCRQNPSLAEDVLKEHKTVERCVKHVLSCARKEMARAGDGLTASLSDETVFEWAEDYFHKDDLEEIRKSEKKEAKAVMQEKKPEPKPKAKPKNEVPQQMDFFSMFGEG